uniref:Uncharacterized protein n=1 Tax=Compsopogon caeruleus TaxID=31354 RepID=A0A7S1T8T4_9RHOD|mmetsp:Transcript_13145/g.26661  ORF Transcript_13145/g.26661 Transcript_13145/m.26661 type:complete len:310 (+) Transcript_13145:1056-1985(+)
MESERFDKDPSHRGFYPQFFRGLGSGARGLALFVKSGELRGVVRRAVGQTLNTQIAVLAAASAVFLILRRNDEHSWKRFLVMAWKWSRILSSGMIFLMEKKYHSMGAVFDAAVHEKSPGLAAVLEQTPRVHVAGERRRKLYRFFRILGFRCAILIMSWLPGLKMVAQPALKFAMTFPILGAKVAAGFAALVIATEWMEDSVLDEVFIEITEAVIDAYDFGKDSLRYYIHRLPSLATRDYFLNRYQGYITGMGFCYSLLMQIPILGVPFALIGECGAAELLVELLERNRLKTHGRVELLGEELVDTRKHD